MVKIVLCSINSKFIHSSLGVWYLKAAMIDLREVECVVIEATINEDIDEIYERIVDEKADIVGFSTYIWNKLTVLELAKRVRNATKAKILLGGPEVSYNAKEIMEENEFVDYIISGEGEEPIRQLSMGYAPDQIDGLIYKKGGEVYEKSPCVMTSDPPNPYTDEYFERLNGRIAYIETSRGCPFKCAFCLSGRCGGVRFFNLEQAKSNIIKLANSGTQTVKFIDRTFNADKKRAREIFEFLIDSYEISIPSGVCFHFEIEGELLDEETFEVLRRAPKGLLQFEVGVQSFNYETLKAIDRKANIEKLKENVKSLIKLGNIHTHIDLIVGLPFEGYESFKASFNEAYSLKSHMLQIGFLKLLHGTKMRENQVGKYAFSHTPPYEIEENEWLSRENLIELHMLEDVFEKMYNSRRFGLTCEYLERKFATPFEIYAGFAKFLSESGGDNSLDTFTEHMYNFFAKFDNVNNDELRDCLAIDRLATNRMGALPYFLKYHSPLLKSTLNDLEKNEDTKSHKGIKRAATVLKSKRVLAYVDYTVRDYVTNRFLVKFTEI